MNSNPRNIRIDDYNYPLPQERIALHPLEQRDACKLLVCRQGETSDHIFSEIPSLLPADAFLICNNTRVINARLRFHKSTGALIEIFCLEPYSPADYAQIFAARGECSWHCLIGNAKKWKSGELEMEISTAAGETMLRVLHPQLPPAADNSRVVTFQWDNHDVTFSDIIAAVGEIPIPPYLNRDSENSDKTDYQTVYSHIDGSVAAPTAGLHFTPSLLDEIRARGIDIREVTLHVGAGTFRPVKSECIGEHDMHSEFIAVPRAIISDLANAETGNRPVVAVGTTSVRTLESLYHIGRLIMEGKWTGEVPQWTAYEAGTEPSAKDALDALKKYMDENGMNTLFAHTRIIIAPGYRFRIVRGMVTNFHQPQSTLLLLVSAFIGNRWRDVYNHALSKDYRFLSYGDACYFEP